MLKTNIGRLRFLAILEGISWVFLLGVGMPMKYMMEIPEPNKVFGMLHGLLFILYCLFVYIVSQEYKWNWKTTGLALLASIPPFGTILADVKIFKPIAKTS